MTDGEIERLAEEYAAGRGHEHYHHLFEEHSGTPSDFAKTCYADGFRDGLSMCWSRPAEGRFPADGERVFFVLAKPFFGKTLFVGERREVEKGMGEWLWYDDDGSSWFDDNVALWCSPALEEA